MKKLISLAALFAAISYAAPASAVTFGLGGDLGTRVRAQTYDHANHKKDDLYWQYRVRLNGSADLGDGFFAKVQVTNEAPNKTSTGAVALGGGGGWQTIGYGNSELYSIGFSQAYFGRGYGNSHYAIGRLPLNATNNPILDITLYPKNPLDTPTATFQNDRLFGANYGTKIGPGELNLVVGVFDNLNTYYSSSQGNDSGLLNDGYAFIGSYKTDIGSVTIEPEVLTAITRFDSVTPETFSSTSSSYGTPWHQGVRPWTFGLNLSGKVGEVKLGASGFYNITNGTTPDATRYGGNRNANVDYTAYLLRIKAEYGPFLAWYDHSVATDKSKLATEATATTKTYTNNFVWAQYQFKAYESNGTRLVIQPTLRYLTSKDSATTTNDYHRLRSELYATITF
ncbi:MAG: hypothetical protein HGB29_10135 [Chlorobiaceae bacterium]|nr:hypothetical protein [Chlorobiaceae bacterium]NTW75208.1 hypothetical protein [Chlorobiaceae bacterium]